MKYLKNTSTLKVNADRCTGCGLCLDVCPHEVLKLDGGKIRIVELDRCIECGACAVNCAFGALTVRSGVGCAAAVINGILSGGEPSCGCDSGSSSGGCC